MCLRNISYLKIPVSFLAAFAKDSAIFAMCHSFKCIFRAIFINGGELLAKARQQFPPDRQLLPKARLQLAIADLQSAKAGLHLAKGGLQLTNVGLHLTKVRLHLAFAGLHLTNVSVHSAKALAQKVSERGA